MAARRLVPSPALQRVLATLAALRRLDTVEPEEYAPRSHSISADQLRARERELDIELPTDAIVLEALRIPIVEKALGSVHGNGDHPALEEDPSWCPVWAGDPWAMTDTSRDRTYQQAIDLYVAIRRESPMPADPDVLIAIDNEDGRELSLSAFLLERIRSRFIPPADLEEEIDTLEAERRESLWQAVSENPAPAAEVERDYAANIVEESPPATGGNKRVEHAKFGTGTIVSSSSDVVEVQFDSGEKKKLKRAYVREL